MYYLDIFCILIILALYTYFFLFNIIRRFDSPINRLLSLTSFISLLLFSSLGFQLVFSRSPHLVLSAKIYLASLFFISQLIFHFAQMYPRFERQTPGWIILLSAVPGIAVTIMTVTTDLILKQARFDKVILHELGDYSYIYFIFFGLYLAGILATFLYKYRNIENESFKNQLLLLYGGIVVGALLIVVCTFVLPFRYGMHAFKHISLIFSSMMIGSIINYALSDVRILDFKQFYQKNLYWITVFVLLTVPSYLILKISLEFPVRGYYVPPVGIAIFLFVYLFLFYRFAGPALERFFRRGYIEFERNVTDFYQELTSLGNVSDQAHFWEFFFDRTITTLEKRFLISRAAFYIYNVKEKAYEYSFGFGEKIEVRRIEETDPMVKCLIEYKKLIEISLFITDTNLQQYRRLLYKVFRNNDIRVMIPYFNNEKQLIAILALGALKERKPYSVDLLYVLDVYRIQMEQILSNAIMIEDVKVTQVVEHDKLVVEGIKKKLIPKELKNIPGMRLSSFYINNSHHGGNYFESFVMPGNRLGLFIADISDVGVESALILLELYTVLHNQPEKHEGPEKMLNIMNWVLSTSRFSTKYAQAYYMVYSASTGELFYSNAAFNAAIIYDPEADVFSELDTKGIPVGIDKNFAYEVKSCDVKPGQIGFLYSDGLVSALNKNGESFPVGRVKDMIRLNHNDSPAVLSRKIYEDFRVFTGDEKLMTDVSLVIFKIMR